MSKRINQRRLDRVAEAIDSGEFEGITYCDIECLYEVTHDDLLVGQYNTLEEALEEWDSAQAGRARYAHDQPSYDPDSPGPFVY